MAGMGAGKHAAAARAIAARPAMRLGEVARTLGISIATAHYHAGKLVRAGVLREEAGSGRRLALTAAAIACMETLPLEAADGIAPARALVRDATAA